MYAPRGVVGVRMRAIEQGAVLKADRVDLARTHADEGAPGPVPRRLEEREPSVAAANLQELHARLEELPLPGVGGGRVREQPLVPQLA